MDSLFTWCAVIGGSLFALQFVMLLLGLGGGSLVHYLQYHLPLAQLHVIEKEQTIIDCAKHYFEIEAKAEAPLLNIKQGDGWAALQEGKQTFDLIFLDILSLDQMPFDCFEVFYQRCYQHLTSTGTIAINHILSEPPLVEKALQAAQRVFNQHTLTFPLKGHFNMVMLATKSAHFQANVDQLVAKKVLNLTHNSEAYGLIAELT